VVEELLDALEDEDTKETNLTSKPKSDVVMAIGSSIPVVTSKRKTMRLCGRLAEIILVDSRSIASFISSQLADQLSTHIQACSKTKFITTDGTPMTCTQHVDKLKWYIQGYEFKTTMGILPFKCYVMILGHDWLEDL